MGRRLGFPFASRMAVGSGDGPRGTGSCVTRCVGQIGPRQKTGPGFKTCACSRVANRAVYRLQPRGIDPPIPLGARGRRGRPVAGRWRGAPARHARLDRRDCRPRAASCPVFFAWQERHNPWRLDSSSVPPCALALMWSTMADAARWQARQIGSRRRITLRIRCQVEPYPRSVLDVVVVAQGLTVSVGWWRSQYRVCVGRPHAGKAQALGARVGIRWSRPFGVVGRSGRRNQPPRQPRTRT